MTEAPARRIPTLDFVSKSYTHTASNVNALLRVIGGWTALYGVAFVAWFYGVSWLLQSDTAFALWFDSLPEQLQDLLVSALPILLALAALPAVAVAWHRFVLLGEAPTGFLQFHPWRAAQYFRRMVLSIGVGLLVAVFALLMVGGAVASIAKLPGAGALLMLLPLLMLVAFLYVFVRTGLSLPAAAMDDSEWSLKRSWDETRGSSLALLGGTILVGLPFALVRGFASGIATAFVAQQQVLLFMAVSTIGFGIALAGVAVGATFYSLVYDFVANDSGTKGRALASHFS